MLSIRKGSYAIYGVGYFILYVSSWQFYSKNVLHLLRDAILSFEFCSTSKRLAAPPMT